MGSLFVSKFQVKPAMRAEFVSRMHAMWVAAKPILDAEAKLLCYGWTRDGKFAAIESYRDEDRLNALRASDAFKAGFATLMECCDGPMTLELFSMVDLEAPNLAHDSKLFDETYPAGESQRHPKVNGLPTLFV